jgi:ribosomal protein S18 acetylase RimI-like enzyme
VSGVRVEAAVVGDPELLAAIRHLLPQLSRTASAPEASDLETIVTAPGTTLFVARDESGIRGVLTLVTFRIPTGVRAWIEDVVVDEDARGLGVGRLLVDAAFERAVEAGAKTVDLTSRPERESAHRLYESMGFVQRDTTVYRKTL